MKKAKTIILVVLLVVISLPITALIIRRLWLGPAYPPIWKAAASGNVSEVNKLIGEGVNINVKALGFWYWTPLAVACNFSQTGTVEALLNAGADPNIQDSMGRTALFQALGDPGIMHLLLSKGADPSIKSKQGIAPLDFAFSSPADSDYREMLEYATKHGITNNRAR